MQLWAWRKPGATTVGHPPEQEAVDTGWQLTQAGLGRASVADRARNGEVAK